LVDKYRQSNCACLQSPACIAIHLIKKAGLSCKAAQIAATSKSRPTVSEKRLSLTPNGNVRYQLKTLHRDGINHAGHWAPSPGWRPWCRNRLKLLDLEF
jgi:hypothetical protein